MPTLPPWLTWVALFALEGVNAAVHFEVYPHGSSGYKVLGVMVALLGFVAARGRPSDKKEEAGRDP